MCVRCRQYGKDYVAVEDAAHQAHKGIWQGKFEIPADWRKDQKIAKLLAERGKSAPGTHTKACTCSLRHMVLSVLITAARGSRALSLSAVSANLHSNLPI